MQDIFVDRRRTGWWDTAMQRFKVGDPVRKVKGYKFEGVVIMEGFTVAGLWRCAVDNGDGLLHIFSAEQLELKTAFNETRQSPA